MATTATHMRSSLSHLEELKIDPYRPWPEADIVPVGGNETLYRLRIGKLRVEYEVCTDENIIKIAKIFKKKKIRLQINRYTNREENYPMEARSKAMAMNDKPFDEFAALEEDDESTAEELHALIEREKDEFIGLDEYCAKRGI